MEVLKKWIVSQDGLKLYYETQGLGKNKPVLFFVHGVGGDVDAWQFVREPLVQKNFAAISMDLRGHGYSSHPRKTSLYEIKNVIADILAILDLEKIEKVILVGHSYGAIIAMSFATTHSERLEKLVVISGGFGRPGYLQSKFLQKIVNALINFGSLISPPAMGNWHSPYPVGKHHKDYEVYGLVRTIAHNSLASYLGTFKQSLNLDIEQELKKITVPTLLISGADDSIFPTDISVQIQKEIPNSQLEIIPDANHVVIMNQPQRTVDSIYHFLTQAHV